MDTSATAHSDADGIDLGLDMRYFLGVDIGATKSHALVAEEDGRAVGFGEGGSGNYETVGWDGLPFCLDSVVSEWRWFGRDRHSRPAAANAFLQSTCRRASTLAPDRCTVKRRALCFTRPAMRK